MPRKRNAPHVVVIAHGHVRTERAGTHRPHDKATVVRREKIDLFANETLRPV